jgi:RHS repeat-associated protein
VRDRRAKPALERFRSPPLPARCSSKKQIHPFGGPYLVDGELAHAAKFTGKDLDEDTGLYYFNARWYDSEVGRFVEEDPIQSKWLGYFNEKSRERTERVVKVILEEEAKTQKEGRKVELVFKPRNLDEIDSNNWYGSKNRVERNSDSLGEAQNISDNDRRFKNENGVNWYWFCNNNSICFVDPEGTTAYMTLTVGVSGYLCFGGNASATYVFDDQGNKGILITVGLGIGVQAGIKNGGKMVELLSKGIVKGVKLPNAVTIYDLEGPSTTASRCTFRWG